MKLGAIAAALGSSIPESAANVEIDRVSSPEDADARSIVFLSKPAFLEAVLGCAAPAVIARPATDVPGKVVLVMPDPYVGYALAAQLFEDRSSLFDGPVHTSAFIDPSARIAAGVSIGPGCVIGRNCSIGENTRIAARCVIENEATIGRDCRIDSGAVIRRDVRIGDRVIIQSGAVIGSEGFGNAQGREGWVRIPCFGTVIIESDAEIGANATIDRGNFAPTIIRRGVRIDNLVHVAHNVEIGEHTAIAAQSGISGSTRIGKRVLIGGQAGFVGHITVGDGAFVGAQAGVNKSVEAGTQVTGAPARNLMDMRRIDAAIARLPAMLKEFRELKKLFGRGAGRPADQA